MKTKEPPYAQIAILALILGVIAWIAFPSIWAHLQSIGSPSENDGSMVLLHRIQSQSEGKIKLVSFRKTNGKSYPGGYRMEYAADIEFSEDGVWKKGGKAASHLFYSFFPGHMNGSAFELQVESDYSGAMNVRKGPWKVADYFDFEKTERGWRGEDDQLY